MNHFDLVAPIYDLVIPAPELDLLRELLHLPSPGRMLEAGGGTGRVASQLSSLVGMLVIDDLSAPMLREAQEKGPLHTVQSYAERLPFPDASFSRVLAVDALHHFLDQGKAVGDLLRILSAGGRLVIEEPDIRKFPVKVVALLERLALMRSRFLSPEQIQTLVGAYGLRSEVVSISDFTIGVVVDK